MVATIFRRGTAIATAAGLLLATGCTMNKQEAPPLTGPSELGTSVTVQVTPDVIQQDGASQSLVTITARDGSGSPIRNLSLRAEIQVNGVTADFGTLSARNVVTDTNGKATLIYTAPTAPPAGTADGSGTAVDIVVTPVGTDAGNAYPRSASIRLVPPGVVTPPNNLIAKFTVSTANPSDDTTVLFDATDSIAANPSATIVSYAWDFGDGSTASGRQVTHQFTAGSKTVRLTITDQTGRTGTATQIITVTPTTNVPVALITSVSPTPVIVGQPVHFNASGSTPSAGNTIISYNWDFGDGGQQSTSNPLIDHVYLVGGGRSYVVTLTVTDSSGRTSKPVTTSVTPQ